MAQQHISSSQFADIMIQRKYDIVMPDTDHPFKDYYNTLLELLQPLEEMNLSPSHYVMILGGIKHTNLEKFVSSYYYQMGSVFTVNQFR